MRIQPRLLTHHIIIVICLASVMLVMTATSPVLGPSKCFPHSDGGFELLTESNQTPTITAVAPTSEEQLITEIISQISEEEIYRSVSDLQNFTTRVYGYPGNTAASAYLYNRFNSISGLNVEYQGGDLRNVIATLPGLDTSSSEIYIAGAHYDSASSDPNNAPGALDDASGVAIMLEFARIMSQYKFNHTLKFACWNREENGLIGSLNYAAYASSNSLNIPLYVNLDSPAYDPYSRFILDIMYNSQSTWAANMLTEHNSLYGIDFTLTYNVHGCGSDHRAFWQHGYTAVMTHEETHGPAHTPDDTIDKVSTIYAKKNGQLCLSVLAQVAEATNGQVHDVEVRSVTPSKTVAAKGSPISIGVTVRNSGGFPETFTVTTSANSQILNETRIYLDAQTSTAFAFTWNTTGSPLGSYSIAAYASPVLNETDLADNTHTGGNITITITGDVSGDWKVDLKDVFAVGKAFVRGLYVSNCDVNDDGKIDLKDYYVTCKNYGKTSL